MLGFFPPPNLEIQLAFPTPTFRQSGHHKMDQLAIFSVALDILKVDQNDDPAGPHDNATDKPPNMGCVIS